MILSDPALVWSIYLLCIVEKKAAVTPTLVLDLFEEILAKLNGMTIFMFSIYYEG